MPNLSARSIVKYEAGERIAAQRAAGLRNARSEHADVDTEAAAIILERWFSRA